MHVYTVFFYFNFQYLYEPFWSAFICIHRYQTIILNSEAKIKSLCADINNLTAFLCNGNHLAIQSLRRRHSSFAESIKKKTRNTLSARPCGLKFLEWFDVSWSTKTMRISTIPRILLGFCGRGGAVAKAIFTLWGQNINFLFSRNLF